MPINVYTGLMGSGKSFECVRSVILPAIEKGRRVVTNIEGVNNDAIRFYLHDKKDISFDDLGHVVHCQNSDVEKADFFPYGKTDTTFCKPGDLICIDEAWRFFGTDKKLLEEHKIFFREHRHYINQETKVSCDLVLMVQDIGDLHRIVKVVVELNFKTTKLKNIGRHNSYRVEMWEGYKQLSKNRSAYQVKNYDKEIFPLYSSYAGGQGKEVEIDSRQNVLTSAKLIGFLITLTIMGFAIYQSISFFDPSKINENQDPDNIAPGESATLTSSTNTQQAPTAPPDVISSWKIIGYYENAEKKSKYVILTDGISIRLENSSFFSSPSRTMLTVGDVDGTKFNTWGTK